MLWSDRDATIIVILLQRRRFCEVSYVRQNENICFRVTDQDVIGLRLDKYLSKMLSDYSRAALQKAIQNGRVLINGKAVKAVIK